MVISSGNFGKHEFLMNGNVLTQKGLLEKVASIKRLEYYHSVVTWKSKVTFQKHNIVD